MSELKAFNSERIYWAVEQVERVAGDIDTLHLDDSQFYLKSEADKVIARNKYKRCLANAEAAMHKRWRSDEGFDYARSTRHMKTWLELAEKFKPNN